MPVTLLDAELAARLRALVPNYDEVGATLHQPPPGYSYLHRTSQIGFGREHFTAAVNTLFRWQMHSLAGLRVSASALTAEPGTVVVLGVGSWPVRLAAPCRVIYVIGQVNKKGFAYGTLPGHPECGEESFIIDYHDSGEVFCTITAFSRPGSWQTRISGPIGPAVQRWITARYLRAVTTRAGEPSRVRRARRKGALHE